MIIANNNDMKFFLKMLSPSGDSKFKFRTLSILGQIRYDHKYHLFQIK